jgi:hypothetical protein
MRFGRQQHILDHAGELLLRLRRGTLGCLCLGKSTVRQSQRQAQTQRSR